MIDNYRVLVIITARAGSKGLPGKNSKLLNGKPLIAWPILAAKGSSYVDKIIVSTDGEHIATLAREYGAETPFIRPEALAQDTSTSIDVVEHALDFLSQNKENFDYLVLLEPTSPLTESIDIDNALAQLHNNTVNAKAIVGVTAVEDSHPDFCLSLNNNGCIVSYQKNFSSTRRQELSDVYRFDGSLYISDIPTLLEKKSFYHPQTLPYILPKWKSFEIDDLTDFICIEAIMKNLTLLKNTELIQQKEKVNE